MACSWRHRHGTRRPRSRRRPRHRPPWNLLPMKAVLNRTALVEPGLPGVPWRALHLPSVQTLWASTTVRRQAMRKTRIDWSIWRSPPARQPRPEPQAGWGRSLGSEVESWGSRSGCSLSNRRWRDGRIVDPGRPRSRGLFSGCLFRPSGQLRRPANATVAIPAPISRLPPVRLMRRIARGLATKLRALLATSAYCPSFVNSCGLNSIRQIQFQITPAL